MIASVLIPSQPSPVKGPIKGEGFSSDGYACLQPPAGRVAASGEREREGDGHVGAITL
jgi:hypothetical protein